MPARYAVNQGWRVVLDDLGIRPEDVCRRARLPHDLLSRQGATMTGAEYARFFCALEEESGDPALPLLCTRAVSFESFDPPLFAAMCSPDLNTALARMARFKRLSAPCALDVTVALEHTHLILQWPDPECPPSVTMTALELSFFVHLARMATRAQVQPLAITAPEPPAPAEIYTEFFGIPVARGPDIAITFAAADAARPFLTAKHGMWEFFEPELRKRLAMLDSTATLAERVRAALLEHLPSGRAAIGEVAAALGVSARTLQRRLQGDDTSFQTLLGETRAELARHYLLTTNMSGAEISYLLGYDDPNSFFRAFHAWTGATPEQLRASLRANPSADAIG